MLLEIAEDNASLTGDDAVRFIEVEDAVHPSRTQNYFVVDWNRSSNEASVARLGYNGKLPIVTVFKAGGNFLVCLWTEIESTLAHELICPVRVERLKVVCVGNHTAWPKDIFKDAQVLCKNETINRLS